MFKRFYWPKNILHHTGAIGFDLGTEKLNLIQIDFGSGKPVIYAASSEYHNSHYEEILDKPEILRNLVKSVFSHTPFKGRKIVAALPSALVQLMFITYVCKSHQDESKALLNALEDRSIDNLSDYVIDYIPVNPHESEQINRMALVALAKKNTVEQYLELLDSCHLKVLALEIGPVAIKRLISTVSQSHDPKKILVINFGTQKSYLTILWNHKLLLDREIDFCMNKVLSSIANAFEISTASALDVLHQYGLGADDLKKPEPAYLITSEENDVDNFKWALNDILKRDLISLANEIREVLVYIAAETRGGAVEQIYLMGSLARIKNIDTLLDQQISIPVKTINPFYGLDHNSHIDASDIGPVAGVAVATGLALRDKMDG